MKIAEFIREKSEGILAIAAQHQALNVRIFGSVARGEATNHSDIDCTSKRQNAAGRDRAKFRSHWQSD
jgi:hypothetical protein